MRDGRSDFAVGDLIAQRLHYLGTNVTFASDRGQRQRLAPCQIYGTEKRSARCKYTGVLTQSCKVKMTGRLVIDGNTKCEGTVTLKVGQRQMGRCTNHWVKRTNTTQIKKDLKKVCGFRMSVLADKKMEISLSSRRKKLF